MVAEWQGCRVVAYLVDTRNPKSLESGRVQIIAQICNIYLDFQQFFTSFIGGNDCDSPPDLNRDRNP
jgi:hypothetical protein